MSHTELWWLIIGLSAASYGLKIAGFVFVGGRTMPPVLERCLALIPASLLAALVVKDTFTTAQDVVVDARAVGLLVALIAVWRKAPFIVVVLAAMAATAIVRAIS
ncbi:MAG: AzlD domain-containing protein [Actinobacteria bacterium]|jgi:branched-subunit amino acid transport protein|nr:AzlD domain-containing protein [Actinomycetota bacterium]NBU06209.1 AzlD domain-containing protein [Acidimicrobiia bacterium]NBX12439.1 AzlD domain-containing protein [Acidimicrobiia bacterium]NDE20112.1 AzlD domain-containing protein [Actinomycetota bacterium]NDF68252.1 AzlD domain-containing protein [Actinomycetota bacterium]